jgi:hypothetical protein
MRPIVRGAAANAGLIFHVFAQDSASTVGAGKASVAYSSWTCYYIRNGEAISGAITTQDITTIGTYAAPTANTNIRIKAVDNTNMIGVYEVQIHLDWVNTTNSCQSLTIYLSATGVAVLPIQIPLTGWDPQLLQATPTNITAGTIATVTNLTNLPAVTTDWLTAAGVKADAVTKIQAGLATPTNITAGTITTVTTVTGVTGLTASDVGAIKVKTDNLPSSPAAVGSNMGTVTSVTGAVGSVTGLTASDVGAIKTQTDKLAFTVTNQVDSNVIDWKGATAPAMTGDAYARIGATGSGLTTLALEATAQAIKAKTDALATAGDIAAAVDAAVIDVNIKTVNNVTVNGDGAGTPWGP